MRSGGRPARRSGCDDAGQAAVELALVLPLVGLLLLALVQVGLLVRDQVMVVHAAREAVRQAAVDADPSAPGRAARASSGLDGSRLAVVESGRGAPGSRVRVEVSYRPGPGVPIVGRLVAAVVLRADATMRVER